MKYDFPQRRVAMDAIKYRIRVLNWVVLLVVYVILLLIVKFMYEFLDFMPRNSVITVLSISAGLVFMGLYLANSASKKAISIIDDYSSKLGALLETTKSIHEIRYTDELLETIMDISMRTTGARAGSLLTAEDDSLVFRLVKGGRARLQGGVSIPKTEGIVGWVVREGLSLRVDDAAGDARFHPEEGKATGYEARSMLCVPLRLRTGPVGAVELIKDVVEPFTVEDEELLLYFADQAAIAFERTGFYEDKKNFEIHITNMLVDAMDNAILEKRGHLKRTAKYALIMARAMGLSEDDSKRLYRAAMLHDIGFLKMRVAEISTVEQYRKHPEIGFEMLSPINFYADIAPIILRHHERFDGRGYPSGLKGRQIPLESRIIGIIEAFDAMASAASYKGTGKMLNEDVPCPQGFEYAVKELREGSGRQFDPELTEVFLANISEDVVED
jgi:putative nucleotidyltransferase with HDIG domain